MNTEVIMAKVKKHQKTIIVVGATTFTFILGAALSNLLPTENSASDIDELLDATSSRIQISDDLLDDLSDVFRVENVTHHCRMLPAGYKASKDAIRKAAEYGLSLDAGQTFVSDHSRRRIA